MRIRLVDAMTQMYKNGSKVMTLVLRKLMMVRNNSKRIMTNSRSCTSASTAGTVVDPTERRKTYQEWANTTMPISRKLNPVVM